MKEKKGIAGLFLAGVLLANGTAVSAAEVKNLEVNRMPSGDMAEYTPSKPMELLSGQDAAELDAIRTLQEAIITTKIWTPWQRRSTTSCWGWLRTR